MKSIYLIAIAILAFGCGEKNEPATKTKPLEEKQQEVKEEVQPEENSAETQPATTETDQSLILQIINRMQLSRIIEIAPEEPTKSEPDATVRLAKNGKTLVELSFRKTEDSEDNKIWVDHSSRGNVAIEDDGLLTLLRLPHDQFRNQAIFRRPLDEVTSFSVEAINKFSVNKQIDGSWQVTGSKKFTADTMLVNNMLSNIRNGQIIGFVKDNATNNDFKKNPSKVLNNSKLI